MNGSHKPLDGKRVVVVDGGSGIGLAVAEAALNAGAVVTVASSQAATMEAALAHLPGALGRVVDLRDEASVAGFFAEVGRFDHLAITAGDWGAALFASTADLDLAQAWDAFAVRFWGALAAVKHARHAIADDGSIVLTSGMLAHRPRKGAARVSGGRCGRAPGPWPRGRSRPRAGQRRVPGLVLTGRVQAMPEERLRELVAPLPVPRAAAPAEAARAYLYLMLNAYVTGQVLPVDGGGSLV